ncbi:hypothetical protein BH10PSE15_BH10PSE15_16410 [soil metagenome]
MYADRHARRPVDPGSVLLALTINGAVLGGLMLFANPTFKKHLDPIFTIDSIPLDPVVPPPPPPPEPKQKVLDPTPRQPVDTSKPVFVTKIADPTPIPQPSFTPTDGGGTVGTGTIEIAKPVPPVLTGPMIDQRYASLFQPVFPPDEQRAGRGGRVELRILVGVDGRVKQVERISATSDSFFEVTRKRALDTWRFKPGTRDGIPVEAWRTIAVSFVLNDSE